MYHVELRQFPHNMCKFNLSERELLDTIAARPAARRTLPPEARHVPKV